MIFARIFKIEWLKSQFYYWIKRELISIPKLEHILYHCWNHIDYTDLCQYLNQKEYLTSSEYLSNFTLINDAKHELLIKWSAYMAESIYTANLLIYQLQSYPTNVDMRNIYIIQQWSKQTHHTNGKQLHSIISYISDATRYQLVEKKSLSEWDHTIHVLMTIYYHFDHVVSNTDVNRLPPPNYCSHELYQEIISKWTFSYLFRAIGPSANNKNSIHYHLHKKNPFHCDICYEMKTEEQKISFQCNHSLCRSCMIDLCSYKTYDTEFNTIKQPTCPFCRSHITNLFSFDQTYSISSTIPFTE